MRVRIKATRRWFGRKRWRAGWQLEGHHLLPICHWITIGSETEGDLSGWKKFQNSISLGMRKCLITNESSWDCENDGGKYILCYRRETEPLRRMTEQYIMGGFGSGWMQSPSKCNLLWIPQRKISLKLKSTMFCSLHPQYVLLHFTPKEYENS